ncbi:MAG: hypothetical protein WBM40_11880 [Thiohalocapsa sp.]
MDRIHAPPSYSLVAWLFLRGLGLIDCAAFASLAVPITALAGADSIYPISEQFDVATQRFGGMRWLSYPALFWIAAGD